MSAVDRAGVCLFISDLYDATLYPAGSGPAAQKCALESVKYGKSVSVVDKSSMLGGVCVHTGTIPSKTFRQASTTLHAATLPRSKLTKGKLPLFVICWLF